MGWKINRPLLSPAAQIAFYVHVGPRRRALELPADTLRGMRFLDDDAIRARIESTFTEAEFMTNIGPCIDRALEDAARADYWYHSEKDYDGDRQSSETEIANEDE